VKPASNAQAAHLAGLKAERKSPAKLVEESDIELGA